MLACQTADAIIGCKLGTAWIGLIICATKRPSIGNLLKHPKTYP
jgi:hypothetical protein